MNCKIEITPEYFEIVARILSKHLDLSEVTVYVFGSRAKQTAKRRSDLDLAIESLKKPLSYSTIIAIKNDFEDSVLPYTVDVVDLNSIDPHFKNLIKNDFVKLNLA